MYESLTRLIEGLNRSEYGTWVIDKENDGTPEHPIHFPFVAYDQLVTQLKEEVYRFVNQHKEMELNRYSDILEKANINWGAESMEKADVSAVDGKTIMALLVGAIRAERFCDGALLGFCKSGAIVKWLSRLKEIDEV